MQRPPLSSPHRFQRMRSCGWRMRSDAINVDPADHKALMAFCRATDDIQSGSETQEHRCQQRQCVRVNLPPPSRVSLLNAEQEQCHPLPPLAKLDLPGGDTIRQGTGTRSVAFRHSFVRAQCSRTPH